MGKFFISLWAFLQCLFLPLASWAAGPLGGTPYSLVPLKDGRIVYTTSENYTSGILGIIDPSKNTVEPGVRQNLGGDSAVFAFSKNGRDRVLVANRQSWGAKTEIQIFDPSDWSSPEFNVTAEGNLHGAAVLGENLYLAYYGFGSKLGYLEKRSLRDYKVSLSRDITAFVKEDKAEALLSSDGVGLFLLVQGFKSYPSSPDRGALFKLDKDLKDLDSLDIGVNPVSLTARDEWIYTASNGNFDPSRHEAWKIRASTMEKTPLDLSGIKAPGEFLQALYDTGKGLFVVTSVFDPTSNVNLNKVYIAPSFPALGDPVASLEGWSLGTGLDLKGDLWICSSNGPDGALKKIGQDGSVVTYTPQGSQESSGGGGCSVGLSPWSMLLLAPILLLKRCS